MKSLASSNGFSGNSLDFFSMWINHIILRFKKLLLSFQNRKTSFHFPIALLSISRKTLNTNSELSTFALFLTLNGITFYSNIKHDDSYYDDIDVYIRLRNYSSIPFC